MKQLIQSYKSGEIQLVEVPDSILRPNGILLNTVNSLVSVGTEKLMISLAKKGYIGKALARPDLVKQVINKVKVDGLLDAYKAVMSRLDTPVTMGYSSSGTVKEIGAGVTGIRVGERVACFGDGFATHSELSFITKNMFVKIPDNVSFEEASFVGLGAIALNAIRVAELTFGENVVVIGLGLLGQLAVQMLKAFGCRVFGVDLNESKIRMALQNGAEACAQAGKDDVRKAVLDFTQGEGADAVILMAGSENNSPIELAADISRDQGRIVACGMLSLDVPRQEFFKKELRVIVSRATGPGKFDPLYENKGIDYPLPYVRWTTQRNMGYFLELVSKGQVKLKDLISHRFKFENALQIYEMLLKGAEPYLGVLIEYEKLPEAVNRVALIDGSKNPIAPHKQSRIGVGLIGAGLHANTSILPAIKKMKDISLVGIADAAGFKGRDTGQRYGFSYCSSDYHELLSDKNVDCVLISTRHNLHARMIIDSLKAGKHVFVEKPLAMNVEELKEVIQVYGSSGRQLMVGFNRRFSPYAEMAKGLIGKASDVVINCRVNAGFVEAQSWVHDSQEGGGRVIGEVCHFVDLVQYLSGSLPVRVFAESTDKLGQDNLVMSIKLNNGSVANILYASQGDRLLPRERVEVFCGNSVCVIDNFRSLFFAKEGKSKKKWSLNLDRGYHGEFRAFFNCLRQENPPLDIKEYIYTTLATFAIVDSVKTGRPQDLNAYFSTL